MPHAHNPTDAEAAAARLRAALESADLEALGAMRVGAVGSGRCEIFLCLDGQGGRGREGGTGGGGQGVWLSVWVDDVDAVHATCVGAGGTDWRGIREMPRSAATIPRWYRTWRANPVCHAGPGCRHCPSSKRRRCPENWTGAGSSPRAGGSSPARSPSRPSHAPWPSCTGWRPTAEHAPTGDSPAMASKDSTSQTAVPELLGRCRELDALLKAGANHSDEAAGIGLLAQVWGPR